MTRNFLTAAIVLSCSTFLLAAEPKGQSPPATQRAAAADETHVPLTITGGHDTDPRDHGRPVILVAAGLKVPEEVFRETFTHVRPSHDGPPTAERAQQNKKALMDGLAKYGVTNERLDEVSNFYRYQAQKGQLWKNASAAGYAVVKNGKIASIVVTEPGYGYSSEPKVSVKGFGLVLKTTIAYGTDLMKNGSIKEVVVAPETRVK
jgi:hypothetical protein